MIPVQPRERMLTFGITSLEDTELIALLVGSGVKGASVQTIAVKIQSLIKNGQVHLTSLLALDGISIAKASSILAALELGKRICDTKKSSVPTILNPIEALPLLSDIRLQKKEHFVALYLNTRHQLLYKETVSVGTLNNSLVHPREVFEPAIKYLAAHVLVSHNHPSGEDQPSDADISITKRLVEAGKILGIEIMDHIIVTYNSYYSFLEHRQI